MAGGVEGHAVSTDETARWLYHRVQAG